MQKKHIMEVVAGLLVVMATVVAITGVLYYEDKLNRERHTVVLLARAPELGNWDLPEINLTQGEPVRLKIRNVDTVTHGFTIPELGVGINNPVEIKAGHVAFIELTPAKEGTFLYACSVWCSKQHPQMTGKIIVSRR